MFAKFEASIAKKYEQQLADFNEDDYRQLEYLKELFEFLDQIVPEDDDDDAVELPKKKGGKKRYAFLLVPTYDRRHRFMV
jgi:condensin complex subunit 3